VRVDWAIGISKRPKGSHEMKCFTLGQVVHEGNLCPFLGEGNLKIFSTRSYFIRHCILTNYNMIDSETPVMYVMDVSRGIGVQVSIWMNVGRIKGLG